MSRSSFTSQVVALIATHPFLARARHLTQEYGPVLRPWRWHMGLFCVLLLLFLGLHIIALSLPSWLYATLNKNDQLHVSYSAAHMAWLPPALTLTDVRVQGKALGGEQLTFSSLTITPALGQLLLARAGAELTFTAEGPSNAQTSRTTPDRAASGASGVASTPGASGVFGTGQLYVRTGLWFDPQDLFFSGQAEALPLTFTSFATRFDPRMQAFFTGNVEGTLTLGMDAAGRIVLRDCTATGKGLVKVVSARNGMAALKAPRLVNATLTLGGSLDRRTLTLHDTRFSAPDVQATLTGKIVFDWRVLENAEVNVVANITANPDAVQDQLLNEHVRLLLSKNLPFAIQGTVRALRISPML